MTAELCPTCGIWWRGVEHSCRLPIYSTSTAGLALADADPRDAELARLRAIEEAARALLDHPVYRIYAPLGHLDDALRAALGTVHRMRDTDLRCVVDGETWPCAFAKVRAALGSEAVSEPDPNRTGMPKCPCGDIAFRPDPVDWRKPAWRCGGCHRVLGRCTCAALGSER